MTEPDDHKAVSDTPKEEALAWLMRLTSGDATTADVRAMDEWRRQDVSNEAALVQASRLWQSVGPAVDRVARQTGKAARPKQSALPGGLSANLGRRALLGGAVAAAAAYAVLRPPLDLWPSLSELTSDYRTATGEQRRITVADGVSVELNTATSIDVKRGAGDADRIELISGETVVTTAAHAARPLVVMAADGRATAMDATFNIRYSGALVCVTCMAGSVKVEQRGRMVMVQERQQVSYASDGLGEAVGIDPAAVTAWRDGVLIFHNAPLAHVIDEVNRYRPGKIIVTNSELGKRLVTARFKLTRLQDVITQVQQVFGASITRLPANVILLSS